VEKVQMLVLKTFSFIRAQISDQIELYADSFFKLPMMRRLEEDMSQITLSDEDMATYGARRDFLEGELTTLTSNLKSLEECINKIQQFSLKCQSRLGPKIMAGGAPTVTRGKPPVRR
jgi:hypothetical protein